jgi:hypothetical protein
MRKNRVKLNIPHISNFLTQGIVFTVPSQIIFVCLDTGKLGSQIWGPLSLFLYFVVVVVA